MTENTKKIVNTQVREELYSSYIYLALAARLQVLNLPGMANWMTIQAKEEVDHAMGFFRFMLERNQEPVLEAIAQPDVSSVKNAADAFAMALKHEEYVSDLIHKILEMARAEKDYALESFVKWYVDEQVEEEANAIAALEKIKMAGGQGPALLMVDAEMAARAYRPSGPYAAKA